MLRPDGRFAILDLGEKWLYTFDRVAVVPLGECQVQLGQSFDRSSDGRPVLLHQGRKLAQDTLDLSLLIQLELPPAVVQFHRGQGLYEEGRAAGGLVVDDPRNAPLALDFDGNDVAPGALGDDRLLQDWSILLRCHDAVQPGEQLLSGRDLFSSNTGQFRAGCV